MLEETKKRFVATNLSPLWLRLTGRDEWLPTVAFVFSSEYVPYQRNALAHYHTVYSYKVGDDGHVETFDDFSFSQRLRSGETITIRSNPRKPNRSYFPEQLTDKLFFIGILFIESLIGLIVIIANLEKR